MNKSGTLPSDGVSTDGEAEPVLFISDDYTIHSHNSVLPQILGNGGAKFAGRKLDDLFIDHDAAQRFRSRLMEELRTGTFADCEATLQGSDGKAVSLSFRAFSVRGKSADRVSFILVGQGRDDGTGLPLNVPNLALFPEEDPNPVLRISGDGRLQYANRGSWMLLAHWGAEIGGQIPLNWIDRVRETLESREVRELELDVGIKTLHLVIVPIPEEGCVNLYGLDVTRRRHAEEKLRVNAQVFENATEGIMITDPDLRIIDVNNAFCRITGYAREEILGEHASLLNSDRHDDEFYRRLWATAARSGSWQGEVWDRRRNGDIYPKWLSVSAVADSSGAPMRFISIFSDITVLKRSEEQLHHMAHYDSLTGLANRRYFLEILTGLLLSAGRSGSSVAVMFIDLDGFKLVNDTLGHAAGDRLLLEAADRLRECIRSTDTVARMGGDEFTVALSNLKETEDAAIIARKVLRRITEPLRIESREVLVTASIGISLFPVDGSTVDLLLQCADTAMYRAKESGKNGYQFFSQDMNARAEERFSFLTSLRQAIDREEFIVHFQPQVRLSDGALSGLEALVRWRSPDGALIGPAHFVQAAEDHGMIGEIGDIVFQAVCRQVGAWRAQGLDPVRIGVNISAHQLRQPDFVSKFQEMLELELTERVMVVDDRETLQRLERLKSMGFTLAIDDFGTKYSSLAYLKRFPIDRLKIDSSFVKDLTRDSGESEIASVIIAMGRSLGMDVIAEGVETSAQAECLREMDCPDAQGYYFGVPVDAADIAPLLGASATVHVNRSGRKR